MPHGPVDCPVKGRIWLAPGAGFNAGAAAGPLLIADPHTGALFNIIWPFLITVVNDLVSGADRPGRAFPGAFPALGAKIL